MISPAFTPWGRWLGVAVVALAVTAPVTLPRVLPAHAAEVSAATLADKVRASADEGWSGEVSSSGALQVPDVSDFGGVARLFGEDTELRVWWRDAKRWRVDRVTPTGESDRLRDGVETIAWSYENRSATYGGWSSVRLPEESDVIPASLARRMLSGVPDRALSRLPDRRVNGTVSAGLRIVPRDSRSTLTRIDLWADPRSGIATRVEVYAGGNVPVLSSEVSHLDQRTPSKDKAGFDFANGIPVRTSYAIDDAAGANAFAPFIPPAQAAGLKRTGDLDGAVGVYGRGPTALLAIPLRRDFARDVYRQLDKSPAAKVSPEGAIGISVGPISVLLTEGGPRDHRGQFLLTGTVTPATLTRAAKDLENVRYAPGRRGVDE